jgi:ankyrin repeat protein
VVLSKRRVPLHAAARYVHVDTALALLEAGTDQVDANWANRRGRSPLWVAARNSHALLCSHLLALSDDDMALLEDAHRNDGSDLDEPLPDSDTALSSDSSDSSDNDD